MSEGRTSEEPPDPLIGKVFDERYRIESTLGQGGIGAVYRARHLTLGRMVALKVLLAHYESVPVLKERFAREAEALAALSHPNIVTVTDYGVEGQHPYIVMELLQGSDLAELLYRTELEPKRALEIVKQSLRALAYAHERGLVHRDLKPHNIFVRDLGGGSDHVVVLDFGLARFVNDSGKKGPKLTRQGALIGTPAYMAPEQASGEEVDARADIYAMGCVLYEALTGRRVFDTSDPGELLRAHLLSKAPSIEQSDPGLECSDALEALVARALEKSPSARFQTALEMIAALEALGPNAAVRVGPRPERGARVSALAPTQQGQSHATATRGATPSAKARSPAVSAPVGARSDGGSVSLPRPMGAIYAAIALAAVIAFVIAGAVVFAIWGGDDDAAPAPTGLPAPAPPTEGALPDAGPPAPPEWIPFSANDPLPEPIRGVREAELAGTFREVATGGSSARFTRAQSALRDRVTTYIGRPPEGTTPRDLARAQLLLGHILTDKRNWTDAFERYNAALATDPEARNDPSLLPDLLIMVGANSAALSTRAAGRVSVVYGPDALPELEATIARTRDAAQRGRLERLRDRIVSGAP